MAAGWQNPKAPYDFTQGMWNDYNSNYAHLSWEEYMQMTKWGIKEIVDKTPNKPEQENKKYSFTESYNKEPDTEDILTIDTDDITIPGLSDDADINKKTDPVHYQFDIEPFDYIHDNQMGFAEGNVVKYITRWRYKEDGITDLYKAKQYIEMLIAKELTNGESRT